MKVLAYEKWLYHIETMSRKYILYSNIYELLSMDGVLAQRARGSLKEQHLGLKKKQSFVVHQGQIVWTGTKAKLPKAYFSAKEIAIKGNVFPGFVECHTHSLFFGNRRHEFELRNQGVSYQDIAKQGGGIYSTVNATRGATSRQLSQQLETHLECFLKQGVTLTEVKTGYGLSVDEELRLLKIMKSLSKKYKICPTYLAAHAIPRGKTSQSYLSELKASLTIVSQKKLAQRVDIFIEKNYFSLAEAKDFLQFALAKGFDVCVHADQLTRTGAARLAAELKAKSSDHNICVTSEDIRKIAKTETTCVLLPSADFYIHCPYPPARELIDSGVRVALSTDFNPGTSPSQSVQLVGVLARLKMKMTLPEVFAAWTVGAAYALGVENHQGALCSGYAANFFVSDASWTDFFYDLLNPQISSVWVEGERKV